MRFSFTFATARTIIAAAAMCACNRSAGATFSRPPRGPSARLRAHLYASYSFILSPPPRPSSLVVERGIPWGAQRTGEKGRRSLLFCATAVVRISYYSRE